MSLGLGLHCPGIDHRFTSLARYPTGSQFPTNKPRSYLMFDKKSRIS